jgi:hypothetical protein
MLELPEIVPGVEGVELTVTANVCVGDEPQLLFATTVIFPPDEPAVVLMLVVFDDPVHPEGRVHVYDDAKFTADIEYVFDVPEQILALPVIDPG